MPVPQPAPNARRGPSDLDRIFQAGRACLISLALVSAAINLLMLSLPVYMLQVYDRVLATSRYETLILLTVMALTALLVMGALDALRASISVRVACWFTDRLGPFFLDSSVRTRIMGDASGAQGMRDLNQLQQYVAGQGLNFIFDAPWAPVFVGLIWLLHPMLGMVALLAALLLLALSIANDRYTRASNASGSSSQLNAMHQAEYIIRNAEAVRAMGMLPNLLVRWRKPQEASLNFLMKSVQTSGWIVGMTKFVRLSVQMGIIGVGATLVLRGETTPGVMIAASVLLGRALAPVETAMSGWRNFGMARVALARLKTRMAALAEEPERTRLPTPIGHLSVEGVDFGVPGAKRMIVEDLNFRIDPGEAIAVIGPSGGGKSTLCRLLVGVVRPISGDIRLDGSQLSHWDHNQLGAFIGYLPQDVELFHGTVKDNIARMGEASDEAIVAAARLAQAHEMIQQLPEGYETMIGDSGVRLSGGQRQRIGLARAVFGEPRIIVLDEPNANLDQAGEAALAAAIEELKSRGSTLVIVGHRPSTLAQADKIMMLRGGRIDAFGRREEVLKVLRAAANPRASTQPASAAGRVIAAGTKDQPAAENDQ